MKGDGNVQCGSGRVSCSTPKLEQRVAVLSIKAEILLQGARASLGCLPSLSPGKRKKPVGPVAVYCHIY